MKVINMKTLKKIISGILIISILIVDYPNKVFCDSVIKVQNTGDIVKVIRKTMLKRESSVTIEYNGNIEKIVYKIAEVTDKVFSVDRKTSTDFDYLRWIYKSGKMSMTGVGNRYKIKYTFKYNETKKETQKVDKKINKVLKSLNISNKSEYKKIKAIHDYIVNNAEYDKTYTKYTAYDNLIKKSSVCQGYALLTYKMMTEAGIPCRIITGTSSGGSHAWNIVKLDGKWYNIDCTWDDPIASDGSSVLRYDYFLKANSDMKGYVRDKEYNTKNFNRKYKMAKKSY